MTLQVPAGYNEIVFNTSLWEKQIQAKEEEKEEKRIDLLSRAIPKLKAYFAEKKVNHVYLFGSILQNGKFFEFSDIDIAVSGLQEDYLRTYVELEELLDREIDLVELERCPFRKAIKKHGEKVL